MRSLPQVALFQGTSLLRAFVQKSSISVDEVAGTASDAQGIKSIDPIEGLVGGFGMNDESTSFERPTERIRIDVEPRLLLVTSEPYAVLTKLGYQVAVAVFEKKKRRSYELLIGSKSLSLALSNLVEENNNRFLGLEFWVRKEGEQKMAKYIVET